MTRVTIVYLGRAAGMGEERRVATWRAVLEAAGCSVATVPLLATASHRAPSPRKILSAVSGSVAAETLAWSTARAVAAVAEQRPDAIITITARAHDPAFRAIAPVVLDFVDRLSVSYRDRAAIDRSPIRRAGYRALARAMARLERAPQGADALAAAGQSDARALGATWIPNLVEPISAVDFSRADHDLLFFGNLAYQPNIAAVERVADIWPELQRVRPGTTLLVAGARPATAVVAHATRLGWTLVEDFPNVAAIARRARLALAPLAHASGIQNKVLEAAALGLAQVVSSEALAGFGTPLPVAVAADDHQLVSEIDGLLRDDTRRSALATAARAHVLDHYSAAAWASPVSELLHQISRRSI